MLAVREGIRPFWGWSPIMEHIPRGLMYLADPSAAGVLVRLYHQHVCTWKYKLSIKSFKNPWPKTIYSHPIRYIHHHPTPWARLEALERTEYLDAYFKNIVYWLPQACSEGLPQKTLRLQDSKYHTDPEEMHLGSPKIMLGIFLVKALPPPHHDPEASWWSP